jgi:antitoxin (DNA-binding transcriptional repressor) of toxin-antitoxin stability system
MKTMPVGELKTHFSEVLHKVQKGERFGILYGRGKKPVAMIVPFVEEIKKKRQLGILEGKVTIEFKDDFEMTDDELIGLDK